MVPSVEEGRDRPHRRTPCRRAGGGPWPPPRRRGFCASAWATERFEMLTTAWAGHGESLARELGPDVGCVIALGGDGLVNEVVNGLMARAPARSARSWPSSRGGSGNDYAETLGTGPPPSPRRSPRSCAFKRCGPTWGASTAATSPRRSPSVWTPPSRSTPWTAARSPAAPAPCSIWKAPSISCSTTCRRFPSRWMSWGGAGVRPSSGMGRCLPGSRAGWGPPTVATSASRPRRASTTGCSTSAGPRRSFRPCGRWRSFCAPGAASTREATTSISGERPPSRARLRGGAAGPDGRGAGSRHALPHRLRPRRPHRRCGPAVGQ